MAKVTLIPVNSLLIVMPILLGNASFAADGNRHVVPGELLIKYKSELQLNKMSASIRQKVSSRSQFNSLQVEHWQLPQTTNIDQVIKQLKADPAVDIVEPNYRRYPRALTNSPASIAESARIDQINLRKLWEEVAPIRSDKIKIAIIDDAFNVDHPDLSANIANTYDALAGDSDPRPETCLDEFGEVVVNDSTLSTTEDHGTQVLGIVGAVKDNNIGIDGSSNNAAIYPIRIGCNYTVAAELAAVDWAIQNEVDIISISYGGPMYSELERRAFDKARTREIVVVTAAGNFNIDNDRILDYPSGLDLPNILSVAGTDEANNLAEWSQWGQTTVDIAAPGESFGTTYFATPNNKGDYTSNMRGTSFSAPMVAGVLASLMQRDPLYAIDGSVFRAKAALLASTKPFPNNAKARTATDGYVDAYEAYSIMQLLEPVIVIKSVTVDDSTGNNNGEIDPGESVNIRLVLENQGTNATSFQAVLTSTDLGINKQVDSSVSGYRSATQTYGLQEISFDNVEFGDLVQQNILFKLEINGTSEPGIKIFSTTRYFSIDAGSLNSGISVNGIMRKNGDLQDELHFFHLDVPSGKSKLTITLNTSEINGRKQNLDLLVKNGSVPQFDYSRYTRLATNKDAIEDGVFISANSNVTEEKITIKSPDAGTYYIVVVANEDDDEPNITYNLQAEYGSETASVAGCSIGRETPFDPVLIGLCLLALTRITITRKQRKT